MQDTKGEDKEEFEWNLSAFVSAARSITWALQKEYKNSELHEEFIEWYGDPDAKNPNPDTKLYEIRNDEIFSIFNDIRIFATKITTPRLNQKISHLNTEREGIVVSMESPLESEGSLSAGSTNISTNPPPGVTAGESIPRKNNESNKNSHPAETTESRTFHFPSKGDYAVPEEYSGKSVLDLCEFYLTRCEELVEEWCNRVEELERCSST